MIKVNLLKMECRTAELGLTQTQLANRSGVSPSTLSLINKGRPCRAMTAAKLARALGISLDDLIDNTEREEE